jgi:hypothetical protein
MQNAEAAEEFTTWDQSEMPRPRFSIVIPARNRALTLPATLETCFAQKFSDFEVLVSDNQSSDGTLVWLDGVSDPRLRVVTTPAFYAMSDNFEFALRHARGEYLIFIGGDDGFYPWSLAYLDAMIKRFPSECYDWEPPQFIWPHEKKAILYCDVQPHLQHPRHETAREAELRLSEPTVIRQPLLTGFNIYHGCIARTLIQRVIEAQGRYFDGTSPDLAASLDNLLFAESTLHLGAPVSIAGMSKLSTGWAFMAPKPTEQQTAIRAEFLASNKQLVTHEIPINSVSTTVGPYFGAFVAYWLKKYGSLDGFLHKPWRALYARQLGELYTDQLNEHCDAYQPFADFLAQKGAVNVEALRIADIPPNEPQSKSEAPVDDPIPQWMLTLAMDVQIVDLNKSFSSINLFQWDATVMAEVESKGDTVSIADYASLNALLLPIDGTHLAGLDDAGREKLRVAALFRTAAMIGKR